MSYFSEKSRELAAIAAAQNDELQAAIDKTFPALIRLKAQENSKNLEEVELQIRIIQKCITNYNITLIRKADADRYAAMTGE